MKPGCWTNRHGDGRNSDYVPIEGAARFRRAWAAMEGIPAATFAGYDAAGRIYVLSLAQGGRLFCFGKNGESRWCTHLRQPSLTSIGITPEGTTFASDGCYLYKISAEGEHLWRQPVSAETSAVMFLPSGDLVVLDVTGTVNLYDPSQGHRLAAPFCTGAGPMQRGVNHKGSMLFPDPQGFARALKGIGVDPSYTERAMARFLGIGIAAKNVPAVDPDSGRILIAATDHHGQAGMFFGLDYAKGQLVQAFATPFGPGCDTSPSISFDGRRAYCTDRDGLLYAFDTASGRIAWSRQLPGSASASLNTHPDGTIYVSVKKEILCVAERGNTGEIVWASSLEQRSREFNCGMTLVNSVLCLSDRFVYGTVAFGNPAGGRLRPTVHKLIALDRRNGSLAGETDIGHESMCTLSLAPDGTLYIPSKPFLLGTAEAKPQFHGLTAWAPL